LLYENNAFNKGLPDTLINFVIKKFKGYIMKQEEATINDKSTHQKNTKELETKERLLQLMKSTDLSIREFVDRALELV
jgi:hypothetical protein